MSGFVYRKLAPEVWSVGFYRPDGHWEDESGHEDPFQAAERCAWLNGSGPPRRREDELMHAADVDMVVASILAAGIIASPAGEIDSTNVERVLSWSIAQGMIGAAMVAAAYTEAQSQLSDAEINKQEEQP